MAVDVVLLAVGVAVVKAVAGIGLECGGNICWRLLTESLLLCVLCSNILSIEKDDLFALIVLLLLLLLLAMMTLNKIKIGNQLDKASEHGSDDAS